MYCFFTNLRNCLSIFWLGVRCVVCGIRYQSYTLAQTHTHTHTHRTDYERRWPIFYTNYELMFRAVLRAGTIVSLSCPQWSSSLVFSIWRFVSNRFWICGLARRIYDMKWRLVLFKRQFYPGIGHNLFIFALICRINSIYPSKQIHEHNKQINSYCLFTCKKCTKVHNKWCICMHISNVGITLSTLCHEHAFRVHCNAQTMRVRER